ncbi:hypothetical protein F383_24351 [Gossypium arboreum]|uniref:Uncharacterized protein n=1 Tax=Gossypium arboreum TaxID=29729 RepID=A0A0B0P0C1_GOSAR|nr:hypothetical protein F383_24351 [Gossypium arboreum]
MSQTCLALAYISRPMHVPDMSYTSTRLNADAIFQTWSYTGSNNQTSWYEYPIYFLKFIWEFYYLYSPHILLFP